MQRVQHARGWSFLPKVTFIITLGLITAATGFKASAVDVFTDPVGFVTLNITNTGGGSFNMIGLPMENIASDRGNVSAVTSNIVTVTCPTCVSTSYGAESYLEFRTGSGQGRYFQIISNDPSGDITLNMGSESLLALGNGGSVSSTDTYAIHQFLTISEVLGPATTTPLHPATTAGAADNVLVFSPSSGFSTIFPRINGGATNWFLVGTGNDNTFPILPDDAMFVQRKGAGVSTNVLLVGAVPVVPIQTVLVGGGFNLVSAPYPESTVISNLNLGINAGFHPGTTLGNSDNVLVFNAASQSYDTLFLRISGGATNWNLVGTGIDPGYPINLGQGFFISSKTTGGYWVQPKQY